MLQHLITLLRQRIEKMAKKNFVTTFKTLSQQMKREINEDTFQTYVATYSLEANTIRYGNCVVTFQNFVATMTQEEYKAGMLRQTHNKVENLRK